MGHRFFIYLALLNLAGCSLVIDGAPGPDSGSLGTDGRIPDLGSSDVNSHEDAAHAHPDGGADLDAATDEDSSSDGPAGDAMASLRDAAQQDVDSGVALE